MCIEYFSHDFLFSKRWNLRVHVEVVKYHVFDIWKVLLHYGKEAGIMVDAQFQTEQKSSKVQTLHQISRRFPSHIVFKYISFLLPRVVIELNLKKEMFPGCIMGLKKMKIKIETIEWDEFTAGWGGWGPGDWQSLTRLLVSTQNIHTTLF